MSILRPGVLQDIRAVVPGDGPLAAAVRGRLGELGAELGEEGTLLVWDGDGAFAAGEPGIAAVHATLDGAWDAIRAFGAEQPARIVLLAPPPGDAHAEAARAGLENLARTLSIEWARLGITPVTILRGTPDDTDAVADLVAYLASPAGAYFSGTALTLAGARPAG